MKIKYGPLISKQFNKENVLFARTKMKEDFEGSQIDRPIIQSIGGGVGAKTLPTANENKIGKAILSSKKLYAVTSIDRESMQASKSDEGAFVRFTAFPVKIAVDSFNRNLERMITVGDASGSGALITGNASNSVVSGAGTDCDPYVITFDASGVYYDTDAAPFEEGDLINVNSETTDLEIVTIASSSTSVTLSVTGTSSRLATLAACCGTAFGASDKLYMQGSKDGEMTGIRGVISATSGSLYSVTVGRRWKSYQKDASSAGLTTDLINEMVIKIKQQCGKSPKFVLSSYTQYLKLLNLLEDHKRYNIPSRRGEVSFEAVQVMTPEGPIPVVASRFVPADEMYFLNDDHIELCLRPGGFEWFDEDGTVFLRESADSYEARYGGYGQFFVNPHFHGYLHSLAV
jgi:hypothetical protein